jgi:putative peptide zinc metalloprotease protein
LPRPALVDGVELLGEYQGSGLREAPYLVRRPDGHVAQITHLLYAIAARADGRRDASAIAAEVGEELGRRITARDVVLLVEERLAPAGIVTTDTGATAEAAAGSAAPFTLRIRAAVVPAGVVQALSAALRPLFAGAVVGAVLAWLIVFDAWLALRHGLDDAVRDVLAFPGVLLLVYGLAVAGTICHELGHAAACRAGGARPGRMGVGLYYVWPVFYTDVTDAYRLDRRGRIRTDLGGVYFNGVYALVLAAVYFRTGFEPLLLVIVIQHVQAAQQLIPWLRLDGYYVLTDLVGVPDVLSRLLPILGALVPGREPDARVTELKPWVRAVVSAYVLLTVPVLAAAYVFLLVRAPAFFEAAARALRLQLSTAEAGWREDDLPAAALGAVNALALLLPLAGLVFVLAFTAARISRVLLTRLARRPAFRSSASFAAGAVFAALFFAGFTGARMLSAENEPARPVARLELTRAPAPAKRVRRRSERRTVSVRTAVVRHSSHPVIVWRRVRGETTATEATTTDELPLVEELPPDTTATTVEPNDTTDTTATTSSTTTLTEEELP